MPSHRLTHGDKAVGHSVCIDSARREAVEELGIGGLYLEQVHKLEASKETSNEFVAFFIARSAERPKGHEMADSYRAFSIQEINKMIANGERFVPIYSPINHFSAITSIPV